jgi:hypothetical protein
MKPRFKVYENKELNDLAQMLVVLFNNVSPSNFKSSFLEGTTNSTANTEQLFAHGYTEAPSLILVVEGNAYIQKGRISSSQVDVRSTASSQPFKLWIIK